MTDYFFESELLADPFTFQRATNSVVTVYDVNDESQSTPLALKDLNGLPMPNPLTSSADAFVPPFVTTSPQVKMVGGGLKVAKPSFQGVRDEAVAAKLAAQDSREAASSSASEATAARTAAEIAAAAAAGAAGGAAIREDPVNPGLYFVAAGGQLTPDPSNPGLFVVTGA